MVEEIEDVLFVGKEVVFVCMFLKIVNWSEVLEVFFLVCDELIY